MLIRKPSDFKDSDVTPKSVYLNRRRLLTAGAAAAGAAVVGTWALSGDGVQAAGSPIAGIAKKTNMAGDEKLTPKEDVTSYNNYYEFGTDKGEPVRNAHTLKTSPWQIAIGGMVGKPKTIDMDALMKVAPIEERIYRHRCVEAWSMVIPWVGIPLSALLKQVEPTSSAKYVAFESLFDKKQMPLWSRAGIDLPYVEGLRLDEAMNPLALLAFGLYGELLPNQNGAPVRLVVPWKYGFKGIKSIVKITLTDKMPPTTWNIANAREYGFYSNVNPQVDHPRWSQASERRIGELFKRKTLMFNGYGDQVASLYSGMDLRKNY
jgi:sulfoxide reductase catalytic subunit YedY